MASLALLLALEATVARSQEPPPSCGNNVVDPGETCDGADDDDCPSRCGADCTCGPTGCGQVDPEADPPTPCCGDGAVNQLGEECDDGAQSAACNHDCSFAGCGDGWVNAAAGEECDESPDLGRCHEDCTLVSCGNRLECAVLALADTHIEAGEEGFLDHGLAVEVEADSDARSIAYLKFDLREVRARVVRATLDIFCTNGTRTTLPQGVPDSGTVYSVRDSSWEEGNRDGEDDTLSLESPSAFGPGLKFIDVDADGDGAIDATERSRYAPVVTQPIAKTAPCLGGDLAPPVLTPAVVTSAFQSGPGVYSLAIATNDRDSLKWAARQHPNPAWRPVLRLQLAYECGDGSVDPGETCDDRNTDDGDGCDSNCSPTACGNGVVTGTEACDDGNVDDTDCCASSCTVNAAGSCCGNGRLEGEEECDDAGESESCNASCTRRRCGDGIRNVTAGEGCDDGNLVGGDGCGPDCKADCCTLQQSPGCDASLCEECVCLLDPFCCSAHWDERCVVQAGASCAGACLCGGCRPAPGSVCRINPIADTYIKGPHPSIPGFDESDQCPVNDCPTCGESTWDHGGRERFDVDANPRSLAYLKFNLGAVTLPVVGATLRLFNTNPSEDTPERRGNGGDVYSLEDSSWVEGNCDGLNGLCGCDPEDGQCACDRDGTCLEACDLCESGCERDADVVSCLQVPRCGDVRALRFIDVDTNRDGQIDGGDSSPYLPDLSQPVGRLGPVGVGEHPVDLDIGAIQRGPGVYSFVIGQTETPDGSSYTSREFLDPDRQPALELTLGCTNNEQCATSIPCTVGECRDGVCEQTLSDECRRCTQDVDCDDRRPCTTDVCGSLEEGCLPNAPIIRRFEAASCALVPYEPDVPECQPSRAFPFSSRFVRALDGRKATICRDLKHSCEAAQANRSRTRVLRRAQRRLRQASVKVTQALPLPGARKGRISGRCATLVQERLRLAREQLEDLLADDGDSLCEGPQECPAVTTRSPRRQPGRRPGAGHRG